MYSKTYLLKITFKFVKKNNLSELKYADKQ